MKKQNENSKISARELTQISNQIDDAKPSIPFSIDENTIQSIMLQIEGKTMEEGYEFIKHQNNKALQQLQKLFSFELLEKYIPEIPDIHERIRIVEGYKREYLLAKAKLNNAFKGIDSAGLTFSEGFDELCDLMLESLRNTKAQLTGPIAKSKNIEGQETLSLKQVALLYFYKGEAITRQNANEIASLHGAKSGDKLFQHYCFFSSNANRRGMPTPLTRKKMVNIISLFESVAQMLDGEAKEMALKDLNHHRTNFDEQFV